MTRYYYLLLTLLLSPIALLAQSETRTIGRFDEVHVSHGIEVLLTSDGKVGEIYLETENINLNDITTEVNRGVLRIKFNDFDFFDQEKYDRKNVRVTVPVDELQALEVNTGAFVETAQQIELESIEIDLNTGGEAELNFKVGKLRADCSMGAILDLKGSSERVDLKANMGGIINARKFESDYGYLKAGMGAEIEVVVLEEVEASAGMGAVINIYGNPTRVYTSDTFGGEVRIREI